MKRILRVLIVTTICLCALYSGHTFAQPTGYQYRETVTVSNANLTGAVSGFVVPIRFSPSGMGFQNANGYDIYFSSDAAGTVALPYDREVHAGTSAVYWVRLATLSNTASTTLYMFYGNPNANTNGENKASTWTGYGGVWHFNEASGNLMNAAGNYSHGTRQGTGTVGSIAGRFGNALNLNAGTNRGYVQIARNANIIFDNNPNALTIEFWVRSNFTPSRSGSILMSQGPYVNNTQPTGAIHADREWFYEYHSAPGNATVHRSMSWWNWRNGNDPVQNDWKRVIAPAPSVYSSPVTWRHVVTTFNGSIMRMYVDGTQVATTSTTSPVINKNGALFIGREYLNTIYGDAFVGQIDELRISKSVRSAAYVKAVYEIGNNLDRVALSGSPTDMHQVVSTLAVVPATGKAGESTTMTISLLNHYGLPVNGMEGNLSITIGGVNTGVTPGSITQNEDGTYSVSYTPTNVGTDNISISLSGNPVTGNPFSSVVSPGDAAQLAFGIQPSDVVAGEIISPAVTVRIEDDYGNLVTTANQLVLLSVDGESVPLNGETSVTAGSGIATFSDLRIVEAGTYRLSAIVLGSFSAITSDEFTVSPAAADAGESSAEVPDGIAGTPTTITVTVLDAHGNPVTGAASLLSGSVDGDNTASLTFTAGTEAGTYTASYTPTKSGTDEVSITLDGALISGSPYDSDITAGASDNDASTVSADPPAGVTADGTSSSEITVTVVDANNNPVAGELVYLEITDGDIGDGAMEPAGTWTTNAGGTVTVELTSTVANNVDVTAYLGSDADGDEIGTVTVGFVAGSATKLAISTQPEAGASGATLTTQPVVHVVDAYGNLVNTGVHSIKAEIAEGTNNGYGALSGTIDVQVVNGVAAFDDLVFAGTIGENYKLLFTSVPTLTSVESEEFGVTGAGVASQLAFVQEPSDAAGGETITPHVTVEIIDEGGNRITTATDAITLSISNNPASGTLSGTTLKAAVNGLATFDNLSIDKAGLGYTLSAQSDGLVTVISNGFEITIGDASQLGLTTQPSASAQSGIEFTQQPIIQLLDAGGNAVSESGVEITVTVSDGGTHVGSATATTNAGGTATFTDLGISGLAGDYTLTFSSGSLTSVISNTVTLSAGTAAQLSITTQPSTAAQSGIEFTQQPVVQLQDASGNAVSESGVEITITVSDGGTHVGSATATTNAGGTATFTDLGISGPVGNYTITFGSGSLTSVISNTITLSAGTAAHLHISAHPVAGASGEALPTQPVIEIRDADGNVVTTDNSTEVTVSISNGTGGTLGGTLTVTAQNGIVTFSDIIFSGIIGETYVLAFTADPELATESKVVVTGAGTAAQLSVTTQPSAAAQSGIAFTQQPVIQLQDASGNTVSESGVEITVTVSDGGTHVGSATATTDAGGTATFTDLGISGPVGNYTITFGSGSLTSVISNTITLSAGTAAQLSITTQPSAAAQSGIAFVQQPVIQLQDASGNAVSASGTVITASVSSDGTLVGTTSATTGTSGTATFTGLGISGAVGDYTLTFSSSPLTAVSSGTVTLGAGNASASTSTVIANPPAVTADGSTESTITVTVKDANENPVEGETVTLAQNSGATSTISAASGTSSSTGVVTFTVKSTKAETVTYTATITGTPDVDITQTADVTFTAGAPTAGNSTVTSSPPTVTADGSAESTITVTVKDANGNLVAGETVTLAQNSGATSTISPASGTSSSAGVVTFTVKGTKAETVTYTATVSGTPDVVVTQTAEVTFTAGAPTAGESTVTANPPAVTADGDMESTITVTVKDANENPVEGETVTLAQNSGAASTISAASGTSSSTGEVTFTVKSTKAETVTYTATVGSTTIAQTADVIFTAGAAIAGKTTADVPAGTAGEATTVIITVLDEYDNPATGASGDLSVSVTGANAGATVSSITDNGDGTYTVTYTPTKSGDDEIAITLGGTAIEDSPYLTNVSPGPLVNLIIQTQPSTTAQSGNVFAQQPVVEFRDAFGNPAGAKGSTRTVISARVLSGNGTLIGTTEKRISGTTTSFSFEDLGIAGETGAYQIDFVLSTFPDIGTFSATSNTVSLGAGDADASASTVSADPTSNVVADGDDESQITVTVVDATGNPIMGEPVYLEISDGAIGSGTMYPSGLWKTDIDGKINVTLTSTIADDVEVTAYLGLDTDGELIGRATVGFIAGSPDAYRTTAVVPAGTAGSDTEITITVKDVYGNAVTGVSGDLSVTVGGENAGVTVNAVTDNNDGTYTVTYTPTKSGADNIAITLNGDDINGSPYTSSVTHGALAKIELTGEVGDLASGTSRELTVTLQDIYGNTVTFGTESSLAVSFVRLTGNGSVSGLGTVNAASGVANLTITGERPGDIFLLAAITTPTLTSNQLSFTITVDKTGLQSAIDEADNLTEEDYSQASWSVFEQALEGAETVYADPDATQSEIDAAEQALRDAIDNLTVDKTALQSAIAEAESLTETDYSEASWTALQVALSAARDVLDDPAATQSEVDAAEQALRDAMDNLTVDKTALQQGVNQTDGLSEGDYTPASWGNLQEAVDTAQGVLDNPTATQAEVDAALEQLNNALANLSAGSILTAPTDVEAQASDKQVQLTWEAPQNTNGSPIIDYVIRYTTDNGVTWQTVDDGISTATNATVTGLTNNMEYRFRVAAVNAAGTGEFSAATLAVVPSRPVPDETGELPTPQPGESILIVDGQPKAVTLEVIDNSYLRLSGDGFAMDLTSIGINGQVIPITDVEAVIRIIRGQSVAVKVTGYGFEPGSVVTLYVFSTPQLLGNIPVQANGTFEGTLAIPADLALGRHTLQANGVVRNTGEERSVSVAALVVEELDQQITFAPLPGKAYGDAEFILEGTATSGLPISYRITDTQGNDTDIATLVEGNRVRINGAGTVQIIASQPGAGNYGAAEDVVRTLVIQPATLSVSVQAVDRPYGEANPAFVLQYTGFVQGDTERVLEQAPVATTEAIPSSDVGIYPLNIAGGKSTNYVFEYTPSALTVVRAHQQIELNVPGELDRNAGRVPLDVQATSGLSVSLAIDDEQVARLDGQVLEVLRVGTVTVTATQTGNANYYPADPVVVTVQVTDGSNFPVRVHKAVSPNGDGINEFLMIEGIKDFPENRVTIINKNGTVLFEISGYDNGNKVFRGISTGQLQLPAGTYFYVVEIKENGKWRTQKGYFVLRY